MTADAFKLHLGFRSDEQGKIKESEDTFYERMYGIFSLYVAYLQIADDTLQNALRYFKGRISKSASLLQIEPEQFQSAAQFSSKMGLEVMWAWQACLLNQKFRRITVGLLVAFYQIAGYRFHGRFGRQCIKILKLLKMHLSLVLPEGCSGSAARLDLIMDRVFESNQFQKPEGLL